MKAHVELKYLWQIIIGLCLVTMLLLSIRHVASMFTNTCAVDGAGDFHSYWYAGHFIRQGSDPYHAFFAGETPSVPVKYLDGVVIEALPIAQPKLTRSPTNTAPMVLLLSVFSLVSWPLAKMLWLACNLILMFITPWLMIRLLPDGNKLGVVSKLLVFLTFFGLIGTRNTAQHGQVTFLVFALMLGSLLTVDKNWLASGMMLGLAISKYSLALPVFLFFLYERKYRIIATSLAFQVFGFLTLSFLIGESPVSLLEGCFDMLLFHASKNTGSVVIHLASLFPHGGILPVITVLAGTLIVWGLLGLWLWRFDNQRVRTSIISFGKLHVVTILTLWTLLVAYHRPYDTSVVLLFIALVVYGLGEPELWHLSRWQKNFLAVFLVVSIFVMSLPGDLMGRILPQSMMPVWFRILYTLLTVTLILMLGVSIWLLYQVRGDVKQVAQSSV